MQEIANNFFGNIGGFGSDFVLVFWMLILLLNVIALIVDVFTKGVK